MRRTAPTLLVALLLGCARGPVALYDGPERPPEEVAQLSASTKARVHAIDGERVLGGPWMLLPGRHDVWLKVPLQAQETNMHYQIRAFCRVALEAVAGESYTARVRTHKVRDSGLRSRTQIEVGIADRSDTLRALATGCSPNRPGLSADE